jgi:hypothetical protein
VLYEIFELCFFRNTNLINSTTRTRLFRLIVYIITCTAVSRPCSASQEIATWSQYGGGCGWLMGWSSLGSLDSVRMELEVDGDARFSGSETREEKDAMCHQVFQGCSCSSMSVFEWNTEGREEYEAQYQDFLKSQDAGHSAAFWLSGLLYCPLRSSFPPLFTSTFPSIASSRTLCERLLRWKSHGSQQRDISERGLFVLWERSHICSILFGCPSIESQA